MTQNTTRTLKAVRGLRLCAWLIAVAALLGAVPALAGDRAQANYLGFSEDGRYFAFEQYGILDGVGGSYSDVFVIDLTEDKWLDGVPFSTEGDGEGESQSLTKTRAAALQAAQPLLDQYGISNPVAIAALNGDGVLGPNGQPLDGNTVRFGQPFYAGIQYDYTLSLDQLDAANSAACPNRLMALTRALRWRSPITRPRPRSNSTATRPSNPSPRHAAARSITPSTASSIPWRAKAIR